MNDGNQGQQVPGQGQQVPIPIPDPPLNGPPQPVLLPVDPVRLTKEQMKFADMIKPYRYGVDDFTSWSKKLQSIATDYGIANAWMNSVMYNKTDEAAFKLVQEFDPHIPPYKTMSHTDYVKLIQEQFEPEAESSQMKLDFIARHQLPNELPKVYYQDKLRMFERAYPENTRDFEQFFDQVIAGLTNMEMRKSMRKFQVPPNTREKPNKATKSFGARLVFEANVVRKSFLSGELAESEVYGAEAGASMISYRSSGARTTTRGVILTSDGMPIKGEPVESINALRKTPGPCWHCKGAHLIRDCPRKATGLPPSVTAVEDGVNAADSGPRKERKAFRPFRRGGRSRPFKRFNQRVAYLFEDEQGNGYYEACEDEESVGATNPEDGATPVDPEDEETGEEDISFLEMLGV